MCYVRQIIYVVLILFVDIHISIHVTTMAEAAVVIGLVASIASLVELTAKVFSRLYESTFKSSKIPESFRSLSTRLPLLIIYVLVKWALFPAPV